MKKFLKKLLYPLRHLVQFLIMPDNVRHILIPLNRIDAAKSPLWGVGGYPPLGGGRALKSSNSSGVPKIFTSSATSIISFRPLSIR